MKLSLKFFIFTFKNMLNIQLCIKISYFAKILATAGHATENIRKLISPKCWFE